jgi:acyl-CoA synthetase (AMP-forming)/AMP-acid ligase II
VSITIYDAAGETPVELDFAAVHGEWLSTIVETFPSANRIGIIAPTSVEGIGVWKAILMAGKTPIMLQYPTPKLSRAYWQREVGHAIETLGVDGVAHWGPQAAPGGSIPKLDIMRATASRSKPPLRSFADGVMTQLSSGTTGFRKGVPLSVEHVMTHVQDYNQVLNLGGDDCIVSWLPLYHDMGFIAAFLMPMILGVRLVLVDPVTWTRRPELLFELIERHRGTLCYMPNFGFEVMARRARSRSYDLSSMRRWVSCSEPTRIESMKRFASAIDADERRIDNCYAMAENIFAVTQSAGLAIQRFGEADAVSCGPAIPGVSLRVVEGEVWVRSAYSLDRYEGGQPIVDEDGFYPTGDLGEIVDGQLYVLGRKRDVMIHAGRKLILSDVDHEVGNLVPGSAGRIATVSAFNPLLGTDEPVCLIEDDRYWTKNRDQRGIGAIRSEAGLDQGRVEFVAPGFITKTSSGKINRLLTGEHWRQTSASRKSRRPAQRGRIERLRDEIKDMFPGIVPGLPFDQQLDSLGLVNVSLLLSEYGIEDGLSLSLSELHLSAESATDHAIGPVLNVVSLFDGDWFLGVMQPVLDAVGKHLGVSIRYTHVCCPPAPILLADLTFEEQFGVRDHRVGVYDGVHAALGAVRSADLIIVDDMVQMAWPASSDTHYPRISHRFEPEPRSANLCVRWARYSERNHLIATELVPSGEITPALANRALDDLEDYLGTPILRVALTQQFAAHTENWHVRFLRACAFALIRQAAETKLDYNALAQELFAGIVRACNGLRVRKDAIGHRWQMSDQAHWCSWLVDPALVDFVLDRYNSFLVLGKRASIPYLSNEAVRRGKSLTFRSDLLCPPSDDYECVLQTGSWGRPATGKPIFPLMLAGWGDAPANVPGSVAAQAPVGTVSPHLSKRLQPA